MKELRNRYLYGEQVGGNVGLSPELKQKLEILYTNPLPYWLNNLTWYQLLYDQDVAGILGLEPTIEELELDELYSPESTDDYDDLLDTIKQVPDNEIANTLHNSLSYWNEQLDDAKQEYEGLGPAQKASIRHFDESDIDELLELHRAVVSGELNLGDKIAFFHVFS